MNKKTEEPKPGDVFGEWTVLRAAARPIWVVGSRARNYYECRCSCGKTSVVLGYSLRAKKTQSCGHARTMAWSRAIVDAEATRRIAARARAAQEMSPAPVEPEPPKGRGYRGRPQKSATTSCDSSQ